MDARKSVIFCATQRTGSTLVFDDLLNVAGYNRSNSELLYHKIVREETQLPWSELWEEVCKQSRIPGYVVCKVMFHYTPRISNFIEGNSAASVRNCLKFTPELFDAFYNFFADATWVYIDRRNVFAQAVSMYVAETTKRWERVIGRPPQGQAYQGDDVSTPAVGYEYEKLKQRLQGFLAERGEWQHFFRHYKITPIRISYEEAVSGYPFYLKELFDKSGLTMVEAPRPRRMLKVGDQRNEELAELLRHDFNLELCSRAHDGS